MLASLHRLAYRSVLGGFLHTSVSGGAVTVKEDEDDIFDAVRSWPEVRKSKSRDIARVEKPPGEKHVHSGHGIQGAAALQAGKASV